jgi:hypothetical protein
MAKSIVDGVVEAVRYDLQKNITLARVYVRRGPTYSDSILMTRETLVEKLQSGKKYYSGSRKPYLASTFFLNQKFSLFTRSGEMFIGVKESNYRHDDPELAPLF